MQYIEKAVWLIFLVRVYLLTHDVHVPDDVARAHKHNGHTNYRLAWARLNSNKKRSNPTHSQRKG
jgi:hypothetical protein